MSSKPPLTLRRYTQLPALIALLRERKLTLLDPQTWDDRNDAHYMALYKEKKRLRTLLALCLTSSAETYHHWRVFAPTSGGVCITFRHNELVKMVKAHGVTARPVDYLKIEDIKTAKPRAKDLPFLKRYPYLHEKEFRLLYESLDESLPAFDVPIDLSCILKINLSPWLHESLAGQTRDLLRSIAGCAKIRIDHSTLISNEQWKRVGEAAR